MIENIIVSFNSIIAHRQHLQQGDNKFPPKLQLEQLRYIIINLDMFPKLS